MDSPAADPLNGFLMDFVRNAPVIPLSVFAGVTFVGDFAELVMLRQGEFQVQLCLCKPNSEIPDHSHPNVDAYLVYVTGDIDLRIDGKPVFEPGSICELPYGLCSKNSKCLRISPGQSHGATIGPAGGAFMTIQRWLNGKPESIERDWIGPALSKEHVTP